MKSSLLISTVFLFVWYHWAAAEAPSLMNFQGQLTDAQGATLQNGNYSVVFTIYDQSQAGEVKWTETHNVTVAGGLFSVQLGSMNPNIPLDHKVFDVSQLYLGIKIGQDIEMTPRTALVSVPYSLRTATIDGAVGGDVAGNLSVSGTNFSIQFQPDIGGDESVKFPPEAISSEEITDLTILDKDISENAAISVDKIVGTAMNLTDTQFVDGVKTFFDLRTASFNRYLSIPCHAFVAKDVEQIYIHSSSILTARSSVFETEQAFIYAPITLPHGAIMTNLEFTYRHLDNTSSFSVRLTQTSKLTAFTNPLIPITNSPVTTDYSTFNVALSDTIDNVSSYYSVEARWFIYKDSINTRFVGATITYHVSRP